MGAVTKIVSCILCFFIRCYQLMISPCMAPCCRFYPSCSQYTLTAITHKGVLLGLWMGLLRILRCHPWSRGGFDPLPLNDETQ